MHIVVLAGPPCAGKTTLAHHLAQPGDLILDDDDIARDLGSPAWHIHPEPWRTNAEQAMQDLIAQAAAHPSTATAWTLRTTPRPEQRMALAQRWHAQVYILNPGEAECRRRARAAGRPTGTAKRIGTWYWQYRPSPIDSDASLLDPSVSRRVIALDPGSV